METPTPTTMPVPAIAIVGSALGVVTAVTLWKRRKKIREQQEQIIVDAWDATINEILKNK